MDLELHCIKQKTPRMWVIGIFYLSVLLPGNWNKSSTEQLRVFAIFNERTVEGT